ncbi:DUF4265 domain-containing protein [Streptomyces acidiscabies]|uniref:DUF4265 domain-containing protein n=1 Tax=Streptomyces acidiscabies TaxID=42234 RepID=UPI000952D939|nr:DUF4265 domain-containing protein [Streptomyces acidiscabies]
MAMTDLAPFGLGRMLEQLWLRENSGGSGYEVCCVPFYAYGLSLGDVVGKSGADFIDRLIVKSGRRVLRVLFADSQDSMEARSALREAVAEVGLLSEWNGDRHVAIDVPGNAMMQRVFDSVREDVAAGNAFWEWGDSKVFETI